MGLLQSEAGVGATGARGVVMNDASLVRTVHILPEDQCFEECPYPRNWT